MRATASVSAGIPAASILAGKLRDLGRLALIFAFAELPLNRGHLLAQDGLALTFVERLLCLTADLIGDAQHLDAMSQEGRHLFPCGSSGLAVSSSSCFWSGVMSR